MKRDLPDGYLPGSPLKVTLEAVPHSSVQTYAIEERAPKGWTPPTCKTAMGIDIRGQGGFAMLPSSLHDSGQRYYWVSGRDPHSVAVHEAPAWLTEAIDDLIQRHGGSPQAVAERQRTGTPDLAKDGFGFAVEYDIERVGNIKTSLFGGEGLFFASMTGPGRVWLQTLPFSRLADRIHSAFRGDREDVKKRADAARAGSRAA